MFYAEGNLRGLRTSPRNRSQISRPLVSKVRTMKVVEEHDRPSTEVKEMVKEALEENGQKSKPK